MQPKKTISRMQLNRTILTTLSAFFLFQTIYFSSITLIFKVRLIRLYLFLIVSVVYHFLLLLCLIQVKKEFYLEKSGEPLKRLNFPLFLSFIRLSSVPTVLFLLISINNIPVMTVTVPFLCFLFLTDLFDGLLARRWNQTTRIGRIVDSSGDYLNLIVISIIFFIFRLIPGWLFVLICLRLLIQCGGMITLYSIIGYAALKVSFMGKMSVFATMGLYAFELMEYLQIPILGSVALVNILEYATAVIVILSLAEKILLLNKSFLILKKKKEAG